MSFCLSVCPSVCLCVLLSVCVSFCLPVQLYGFMSSHICFLSIALMCLCSYRTPIFVSITTHSPFLDASRPLVTMAAMLPPPGIPVSRIRRASQLNSAGSPCSYHSPCYTPIHAPSESGMASVFSQPTGGTNSSMRPTGLLSSHSLLVNLLCRAHTQLHMQHSDLTKTDESRSSTLCELSKAGSLLWPGFLDQTRWTNRQVSMGFDVSAFSDVKTIDDTKVNSFIELAQRHCLASLRFQSGWGFLNRKEQSTLTEQSTKQITDPILLEQWLQHGSDLCDGRSIPMAPVSTTAVTTVQDAAG